MLPIPPDYSDQQARQERARIVAIAQGLYLERGVGLVTLADVAFALRIPIAAVERQFPEGQPALRKLVLESHLRYIHDNLEQLRDACRNAVEALLAMRRFMQQQMSGSRSLLLPEIEALDPALWRHTQRTRLLFMRTYLRANLQQGIQEGLYRADLDVRSRVRQWLRQVDAKLLAAPTPPEAVELYYNHLSELLADITTPVGAYVVRRLQEAPPYY
jgi:AcrR family transcriptional regulator